MAVNPLYLNAHNPSFETGDSVHHFHLWYVVLGCYHAYLEIILGFPAASVHKAACPVRPSRYKDTAAVELEMTWE